MFVLAKRAFPGLFLDMFITRPSLLSSLAVRPRLLEATYKILIVRKLFVGCLFPILPNSYSWLRKKFISRLSLLLSLVVRSYHFEAAYKIDSSRAIFGMFIPCLVRQANPMIVGAQSKVQKLGPLKLT